MLQLIVSNYKLKLQITNQKDFIEFVCWSKMDGHDFKVDNIATTTTTTTRTTTTTSVFQQVSEFGFLKVKLVYS